MVRHELTGFDNVAQKVAFLAGRRDGKKGLDTRSPIAKLEVFWAQGVSVGMFEKHKGIV